MISSIYILVYLLTYFLCLKINSRRLKNRHKIQAETIKRKVRKSQERENNVGKLKLKKKIWVYKQNLRSKCNT